MIDDETSVESVAVLGRVIAGKFRIDSYLSGGAMGSVYRATHLSLDKGIAIKIMHRGLAADPSFARRFHREAKAASRLSHPNSIQVLDYGEERDGLLYIAMELVGGDNLREVLDRDWPLDDQRIVSILSQTLAAVAVAHELNIVHRDLKPENILLVRGADDDGAQTDLVKVCDFGIAQVLEPTHRDQPGDAPPDSAAISGPAAPTLAGALFGTPEYMAPEHARGERIDGRADLYATGVILYELLTASVPFSGESALAIVNKQITETPMAPSALRPDVHRGLEAVCLRAMTKDREQRYQTAREMRADLRAALGIGAARISPLPGRTSQIPTGTSRTPQPGPALATAPVEVVASGVSSSAAGVLPLHPAPRTGHDTLDTTRGSMPNAPETDPTAVRQASHGDLTPARGASWRSAALVAAGAAVIGFGAFWWTTRGATGEPTDLQTAMAPGGEVSSTAPEAAAAIAEPSAAAAVPSTSPETADGAPPADSADRRAPAAAEGHAAAGATARGAPSASAAAAAPSSEAVVQVAAAAATAADTAAVVPPSVEPVAAPTPATAGGAAPAPAAAAPKPTVSSAEIGAARVVIAGVSTTGGLPASSVRSALKRAAFTGCYQGALKGATRIPAGTAQVVLSISDSGYVKSASVSMGFLPAARGCVQAQASSIKVANVDTGEAMATVTLQFVPQ
ncbi:MAG: serine/threonine-protein kinase [Polyangiaceae bacterium]